MCDARTAYNVRNNATVQIYIHIYTLAHQQQLWPFEMYRRSSEAAAACLTCSVVAAVETFIE